MKTIRLLLSAGRGPAECAWVVVQAARTLASELGEHGASARRVEECSGARVGTAKSVTLEVTIPKEAEESVAGLLKSWEGTVQWVGQSPFRPTHRRKNWFIRVARIASPEETGRGDASSFMAVSHEVRIDTMRSSGPGGQHVNKTESAVRATHLPTGRSVVARRERSQWRNKVVALEKLREAIEDSAHHFKAARVREVWQSHDELARGNPVRVYWGPSFKRVEAGA